LGTGVYNVTYAQPTSASITLNNRDYPSPRLIFNPYINPIIPPSSTDPGCTTTYDIGKTWYDTTISATTIERRCVSTLGVVGWVDSPVWRTYSLVAIANGTNGCTNANGCWQVNGVYNSIKTAGLTQDVVLFQLPAKGFVTQMRMATAVACTGATTALSGLGVTGNNVRYRAQTYDIMAAVTDTNTTDQISLTGAGSGSKVAINVLASLITTVANVDQLVTGCRVDYWLLWGVLP